MELVTPCYFNEDMAIVLAKCYLKSGDKSKATTTLQEVLKKNPNSEAAKSLLEK